MGSSDAFRDLMKCAKTVKSKIICLKEIEILEIFVKEMAVKRPKKPLFNRPARGASYTIVRIAIYIVYLVNRAPRKL